MTLSTDADYPDCRRCATNVLVARDTGSCDWHCHGCGQTWRTSDPDDGRMI